MKATSIINKQQEEENSIEFPILMRGSQDVDVIVLFKNPIDGIVIKSNKYSVVTDIQITGHCLHDCNWTPFTGEITLKNQ